MVQSDGGDYGHVGVDHVGGIPQPAHAYFHHSDVNGGVGKRGVGHGGEHLEFAEFRSAFLFRGHVRHLYVGLDFAPCSHVVAGVQGLAVNGNAFGGQLQVRAGGAPGTTVEGTHQGFDHADCGGFAVGACHMDGRK